MNYENTLSEDVADVWWWAVVIGGSAIVIALVFGFVGYVASLGSLLPLAPIAALFWYCRFGEVPTHAIYNDDTIGITE